MKTPFLRAVFAIARKDLRAEVRSRELVTSMGLFALLSVLIFSFALELDRRAQAEAVSGVVWVTVVFASTIGLNRSLAGEREQASMEGMLMAPIDRATIFFGKLVANLLFTLAVGLVLLPVATVLYNLNLLQPWVLALLLLGTLGFCIIGTLLAAMSAQTRSRESLLPIIMLPVALPIVIAAVRATTSAVNGAPQEDWLIWPQILLVIDAIYLLMGFLLFEYVIED